MGNPIKLKAIVAEISLYGTGIYRVRLNPSGRIPSFKAGQFLHLTLDNFDPTNGYWPESRVFSIASSPNDNSIEIVYSVKGKYTSMMERELCLGRPVWLKLPFGAFIINRIAEHTDTVVLVAGGTGVSPFVPFVLCEMGISATTPHKKIILHYGVRSPEMLLYANVFTKAARSLNGFSWNIWVENREKVAFDSSMFVEQKNGRLDPEIIMKESGCASAIYFLSGPPAMISYFRTRLLELGVKDEHIQIDEWE